MKVNRCNDCNKFKYNVDRGICRSCIQEELSKFELNILEYMYKNNSNTEKIKNIKTVIDDNTIVEKLETGSYICEDSPKNKYSLVKVQRVANWSGGVDKKIKMNKEKEQVCKYILEEDKKDKKMI